MALFVSTTLNKLDAKFRVSVPADFRKSLEGDSFKGVVAWPNVPEKMIEACDSGRVERIAASLDDREQYPEDDSLRLDLARVSLASSQRLNFDVNGRIMVPPEFREHAGIGEEVLFVGVGLTFQMWDPERYRLWQSSRLQAGKEQGIRLQMRPLPSRVDGGSGKGGA
ncbi:MAG: hypothetical protein GDA50_06630 [Alphaproteobacteria bacterium GM202ARS2]|nr:hypothetical protein [Alphaproteobacteria bacterium GM202ARS2]